MTGPVHTVTLPYRFEPRPYQIPLLRAFDEGKKRAVIVWHRRAGKEKTCLAGIVSRKMLERPGSYYYVFPTLVQGRKILWDGMDKDGFRFLDHFPRELLDGKPNDTEMKLRFKKSLGGSLLQIVGSDNFDSVVGTNPIGMVLTEYSLQDPTCWSYFRPILAENGGWAIFNGTPRGENHLYDIFELGKADPENWFAQLLTVDDTKVVPADVLARERAETIRLHGNDALYQQEYHCSFTAPIVGAYYAEQLAAAYREGRVGPVAHEPRVMVDTWWDLGINDRMSIWFTQSIGQEVRVVDYMEGSGQGLPFYIAKIKEKPYVYGVHTAPHDIEVRELSSGKSRRETARGLGIDFRVAPKLPLMDGIDAVRSLFSRLWFDKVKCKDGINALKNYRKEWDEERKTYGNKPHHDWSSNGADALRMLAVADHFAKRDRPADTADKYERSRRAGLSGGAGPAVGVLG